MSVCVCVCVCVCVRWTLPVHSEVCHCLTCSQVLYIWDTHTHTQVNQTSYLLLWLSPCVCRASGGELKIEKQDRLREREREETRAALLLKDTSIKMAAVSSFPETLTERMRLTLLRCVLTSDPESAHSTVTKVHHIIPLILPCALCLYSEWAHKLYSPHFLPPGQQSITGSVQSFWLTSGRLLPHSKLNLWVLSFSLLFSCEQLQISHYWFMRELTCVFSETWIRKLSKIWTGTIILDLITKQHSLKWFMFDHDIITDWRSYWKTAWI